MTASELRNAILLLNCIDADEFAAGLFDGSARWTEPAPLALWNAFQKDPVKFYIHASDAHRNALFAIIQKRLTIGGTNERASG